VIRILASALILTATLARGDVPRVVTDIAPVHSLVAQVMDGVGTPDLIVPPGSDAHHMALRPSDARKLAKAQVVVWVGAPLTPWLAEPLTTLASDAANLTLLQVPGWTHRAATDEHGHATEKANSHAIDPHAWLDPEVAVFWVRAIRDALSTTDPDNSVHYAANADKAVAGLTSLRTRIAADLAELPSGTWLAPHAAFGYFEDRFGLPSAGSVADSDAEAPGPAHLAMLHAAVQAGKINCVLSETNAPTDYTDVLIEGTDARTGAIDDTGMALPPGPAMYSELLSGIAATLKGCIAP